MAERAAFDDRCKRVWEWLRSQAGGATRNQISTETGINYRLLTEAIEALLETGNIERCEVVNNGRKYDGYRAVQGANDKPDEQKSLFG